MSMPDFLADRRPRSARRLADASRNERAGYRNMQNCASPRSITACATPVRSDSLSHVLGQLPRPAQVRYSARDIVDLILKVHAGAYSIEASNPCHDHEWRVWQDVKFPDGKYSFPAWWDITATSSSIRKRSPIAWCATRKSSGAKTSSPARTAASARVWATRKSAGPSFRRWPKARASPLKSYGANRMFSPRRTPRSITLEKLLG